MVLSETQVLTWLGHFLWPFLRITGMFLTAPFYGSAYIPSLVRVAVAAALAAALAFWLPDLPAFPGDPISAMFQGVIQIAFGAVLGMAMQIVVTSVACAGEIVGLSIGLGFAEMQLNEASASTPILYDILFWVGLMGYLAAGGPIFLFGALAHSFQNGVGVDNIANLGDLTSLGSIVISAAVWLALPVIAVSLCINLTVGLTTVFAPQLNLLSIGFPLLIMSGLWILVGSIGFMDRDLHHLMTIGMRSIVAMLSHG